MQMPRTTIRRLTVIVLVIGTVTWAGLAAERTRSNKLRSHIHHHNDGASNAPLRDFSQTRAWVPFWPVYCVLSWACPGTGVTISSPATGVVRSPASTISPD